MLSHLHQARSLTRIPAHRRVVSLLEGEYVALHPGRSTEFTDLREYVRGDDPKDLDWKASARARTLLVRRYHALRKLTVYLVVSGGRRMSALNAPDVPKHAVASDLAGVVGHLAHHHGDLVGVVTGDEQRQVVVPARGGTAHVERCLAVIAEPSDAPSDLGAVLSRVTRSIRRRAFVVIVTDAVEVDDRAATALRRLCVQHEVVVAVVQGLDPMAVDPHASRAVVDVDTALTVPAWLRSDLRLQVEHAHKISADRESMETVLDRLGVAHVHVAGRDAVVPGVRRLLERHRTRRRR